MSITTPLATATLKYGVTILTVDPSTNQIECAGKGAGTPKVQIVTTGAAFRWPAPGEAWMVRQENGSWVLDGVWPVTNVVPGVFSSNPGDLILNSSTGVVRVLGSTDGSTDFTLVANKGAASKQGVPVAVSAMTSSNPGVAVATITIAIANPTGAYVRLSGGLSGSAGTTASVAEQYFRIDGASPWSAHKVGHFYFSSASTHAWMGSWEAITPHLAAGEHTFELMLMCPAGSITVDANDWYSLAACELG